MQLGRFLHAGRARCCLHWDAQIFPLDDLASMSGEKYLADAVHFGELERLLPIDSAAWMAMVDLVSDVYADVSRHQAFSLPRNSVELLPPIAHPQKLLLLAGNYAAHIEEQGETATERDRTFPYVFMKPASNTLVGDGSEVRIPAVSPDKIDHEVELAVIVGRQARDVNASDALKYVAGYTIVNDISDRGFRPNPNRKARPKDAFFDWMHGKWHDGFCPCGPFLVTPDEISDPQSLELLLSVDGEMRQRGSTSQQVFTVAEVIEFLSSWMTLEPGDIISTGTPAGVGNATGKYLRAGQTMVASIEPIGALTTRLI